MTGGLSSGAAADAAQRRYQPVAPVSDGSHCAHLIEVRIGLVRVKVRIG